jgi:hypothetical protein
VADAGDTRVTDSAAVAPSVAHDFECWLVDSPQERRLPAFRSVFATGAFNVSVDAREVMSDQMHGASNVVQNDRARR